MRYLKLALENETPVDPAPVAEGDDAAIVSSIEANGDLLSELNDNQEANSILLSASHVERTVEATVTSGEGMTESESQLTTAAMEHFYERFDCRGTKLENIAVESFKDPTTRLESTKIVLEEIKEFNIKLVNGLTVAQEGLMSRFGNSIKLAFTSEEKIQVKLIEGVAKIKEKGGKQGTVINEPGWGRSFAVIGKKELSPADVIAYVDRFKTLTQSPVFSKLISEYVQFLNKATAELTKSLFIAKDEAVKNIRDMLSEVETFRKDADKLMADSNLKTAKNDPSFQPLSIKDAEVLSKEAIALMTDSKLNNTFKSIAEAVGNAEDELFENTSTRLIGSAAADMRAWRTLINQLNPVMEEVMNMIHQRDRICFACANYIKASTNS